MNLTAQNDQRQSALRLTFYMLVSMVLTIIRAGLDNRAGFARFAPEHGNTHSATPFLDDASLEDALTNYVQSTAPPPSEFYDAALTLLYAAQIVARMLGATFHKIYELMKLAGLLAQSALDQIESVADQSKAKALHLDSSWRVSFSRILQRQNRAFFDNGQTV